MNRSASRAYLRVRGGTREGLGECGGRRGLSPRTRRNHIDTGKTDRAARPISAYAEEPEAAGVSNAAVRAYLRVRGGTETVRAENVRHWGLSPRTRRNPPLDRSTLVGKGPISAYAEEPTGGPCSRDHRKAYLRLRGGTDVCGGADDRLCGLSPPTRRNRRVVDVRHVADGPISAYAEEPLQRFPPITRPPAYLRLRGGTGPSQCV